MKKLLLLIASLSLANELSLDKLSAKNYDCYINYINNDYIACDNSVFKNDNKEFELGSNVIFIDDYKGLVLAISSEFGEKTLNIYKDNQVKSKKISSDINKAFLYKDMIILTSLASEIIFLDLDFKEIKRVHFSNASINTASINKDKAKIALGFESGKIVVYDLNNHTYITKEVHKDNIYNVDFKANKIISCATDRKAIISDDELNLIDTIESNNLIYNCAISSSGLVAYSCDVDNNICVGDEKINIGNLYLNSILFKEDTLRLNAYSKTLYEKDFK